MALTKSLHTVTAATNVARLIYNVDRGQGVMTGAELASKALKALGLALDHQFKSKHPEKLVAAIREHPPGGHYLICWHHGAIPQLLSAFGADPAMLFPKKNHWPAHIFDWVIRLTFDSNGHLLEATGMSEKVTPQMAEAAKANQPAGKGKNPNLVSQQTRQSPAVERSNEPKKKTTAVENNARGVTTRDSAHVKRQTHNEVASAQTHVKGEPRNGGQPNGGQPKPKQEKAAKPQSKSEEKPKQGSPHDEGR